jgi:hypothetical protein
MSVHRAVIGPTMSGKTTLVRSMIREARRAGRAALVCDPNGEPGWGADWVTADPHALLAKARASAGCLIVLEEGASYLTNTREAMPLRWFVQRSRHLGHKVVWTSTKGTTVPPIYRNNVGGVALFGCAPAEAENWADEFNDAGLLKAVALPRYQYLWKERFHPVTRHETRKK